MAKDFNHPKVVQNYDAHIRCLIPGYELVHLQIQAILKTRLADDAKILIAGCGTGYELQYLHAQFPKATFVAIDPSAEMIRSAKQWFEKNSNLNRITFIVGDTTVLQNLNVQFDVALSILVSHFLSPIDKKKYFKEILTSLNPQGFLLSYDLMKFQNELQIQQLQYLTQSLGLSAKQSEAMSERLDEDFQLISIEDMQQMLRNCGFNRIECFTQISNFYGLIADLNIHTN